MASSEAKKKIRLDWIVFIVGAVLALKTALNIYSTSQRAGSRVSEMQNQAQMAKKNNAELKKQLEDILSVENVEKQAKEKLGLGRPGEVILVLPEQGQVNSNQLSVDSRPNWRKWWDLYIK